MRKRGPAPYELTRDEFERRELDSARAEVTPREEPRPGAFYMYSRRERARLDEAARHFAFISKPGVLDDEHRRAVAGALGSGKRVPARVLANYPDLAGRQVPLSRAVDKFNRANEPPGGFSDADLVRNGRGVGVPYSLGLAPSSTPAPVHPVAVGAIVVGAVGAALLLGRMFVNALATR